MKPARQADPFAVLGLPARPGLTDDEVRAAWRRIAAATHPDRADGGDAAAFATAAAAYTTLRTTFGRAEALADLARPAGLRRLRPARAGRLSGPGQHGQGPVTKERGRRPPGGSGGSLPRASTGRRPAGPGRIAAGRAERRWRPAADGERRRRRPAAGLVARRWWSRVRRGRPARLVLRIAAVAAVSAGVALVAGSRPATPALITGALTWLALTARHDLAPPG